jgi:hypothetical protein
MFKLIVIGDQRATNLPESISGAETNLNGYYSVQFFLNGKEPSYLFRLRNKTSNKAYILVKQDSSVFDELNVGDMLDMEYNRSESLGGSKLIKTLITSKIPHDRYTGHSIFELSIIDN